MALLVVQLRPGEAPELSVSEGGRAASPQLLKARLPCLQPFIQQAAQRFTALGHGSARFAIQLHDEDPEEPCFRFDAPTRPDQGGPLIPDPYVLGSEGYAAIRRSFVSQPLPPWHARLNVAIWRGSSTGIAELASSNLHSHPRVRLCRHTLRHPAWLDARITSVVQCSNPQAQREVLEQLRREGLLAPRLTPWQLALHRWMVEIDGNVNSWGLLWKLLSGSCVLRVESERSQWYHHQLQPWVHVVPIRADLGDLAEKLAWCRQHTDACARIAAAAQELAHDVVQRLNEDQNLAIEAYARQWL
jgi:hypothetical protein